MKKAKADDPKRQPVYYRYAPETAEASREEILAAWYDAKRIDPRLTQREFEIEALGRDPQKADGRYLRLIMEGKRTGRLLAREAYRTPPGGTAGVFNIRLEDSAGDYHSFNVAPIAPPGQKPFRSKLDVPRVHSFMRAHPETVNAKATEFARRYSLRRSQLRTDRYTVQRVVEPRADVVIVSPRLRR